MALKVTGFRVDGGTLTLECESGEPITLAGDWETVAALRKAANAIEKGLAGGSVAREIALWH